MAEETEVKNCHIDELLNCSIATLLHCSGFKI